MQRLLPYLLLLLTAFQGGGSLLLPLARLSVARSQAHAHRPSPEAQETFKVSIADFEKNRVGRRECWHGGVLYDLEKVERSGDSLHLTARADAREQVLLDGLQRLLRFDQATPLAAQPVAKWLVQLLASPFLPVGSGWRLQLPEEDLPAATFISAGRFLAGFAQIFSPPPR